MENIQAQWFNGLTTQPIEVQCYIDKLNQDLLLYATKKGPQNNEEPLMRYTKKQRLSVSFEYQKSSDDYVVFLTNQPPLHKLQGGEQLITFLKYCFPKLHTAKIANNWTSIKIVGLLLALIVAIMGIYAKVIPFLAEAGTTFITTEQEKTLGNKIAEHFEKDVKTSQKINTLLTDFTQKAHFNDGSPYSLKLHLYPINTQNPHNQEKDIKNAFALPGGHIFIFPQLLKEIKTTDELIALIGHEAAHVTQRHSLKALSKSIALTIITGILFGDVTGISSPLIDAGVNFSNAQYSQTLETESDLKSYEHLIKYGYDTQGLVDLLMNLNDDKVEKNNNKIAIRKTEIKKVTEKITQLIDRILALVPEVFWDWFASHPNIDKRISQTKTLKNKQNISHQIANEIEIRELNQIFLAIKLELNQNQN